MNKENRIKVYSWIANRKNCSISVAATIYKTASINKRTYFREQALKLEVKL